jgi:hypothetical protein
MGEHRKPDINDLVVNDVFDDVLDSTALRPNTQESSHSVHTSFHVVKRHELYHPAGQG